VRKFISLEEVYEESLYWLLNSKDVSFTSKLGYKAWQVEILRVQPKWWWKSLWKCKAPIRCKLTLWISLNNKLLTWDNGIKRGWCVPNICVLCKTNVEIVSHLFISCPYTGKVTKTVKDRLNTEASWNKESVEECYKS